MSNLVPDMQLDIVDLKQCAPKSIRANITPELTQKINDILKDPDIREEYRDNVLGYIDVLKEGKWKFSDYISAVKFVSYKLRGDTNMAAYTKTFPVRVAEYRSRGVVDYSPWVTSYGKSKLVAEILDRSMVPTYILNADIYQKAVNTLSDLMLTANSEKVRSDSANSLLTHLKRPEVAKVQLDVNVNEGDSIMELRNSTMELVKVQKEMIASGGMSAKDAAHSTIVHDIEDAEFTESN